MRDSGGGGSMERRVRIQGYQAVSSKPFEKLCTQVAWARVMRSRNASARDGSSGARTSRRVCGGKNSVGKKVSRSEPICGVNGRQ